MTSEKCPLCGGELEPREVEKLLQGGEHSTKLLVDAEVCLWCGEHVYTAESVARFGQVRRKLAKGDVAEFALNVQPAIETASTGSTDSRSKLRRGMDDEKSVWVVRGGREGKWEETFFKNDLASIDFGLRQSVAEFASQMKLRDYLLKIETRIAILQDEVNSRYSSVQSAAAAASQLWRFANDIRIGDVILMPRKGSKVVAAGRISGDYAFRPCLMEQQLGSHTRAVEWLSEGIPGYSFDPDILNSMMRCHRTVFQPNVVDALNRIMFTLKEHLAEARIGGQPAETRNDNRVFGEFDQAQLHHKDAIVSFQHLGPARLASLVAEVMRASGYFVSKAHFGEANVIDLLAAEGVLGFGHPSLRVRVNAGTGLVDGPEYERFRRDVESGEHGANHGLLVSLGDFTDAVRRENERSFFKIRLWGPYVLAQRLLDTYEELPSDIRADIPLENRKALVESEA